MATRTILIMCNTESKLFASERKEGRSFRRGCALVYPVVPGLGLQGKSFAVEYHTKSGNYRLADNGH